MSWPITSKRSKPNQKHLVVKTLIQNVAFENCKCKTCHIWKTKMMHDIFQTIPIFLACIHHTELVILTSERLFSVVSSVPLVDLHVSRWCAALSTWWEEKLLETMSTCYCPLATGPQSTWTTALVRWHCVRTCSTQSWQPRCGAGTKAVFLIPLKSQRSVISIKVVICSETLTCTG